MRAGANVPVQIFNAVDPVRPSGGSPDGVGHTQRRDPALWPQARDCGARQRCGGAAAGGGERGAGVREIVVLTSGELVWVKTSHQFPTNALTGKPKRFASAHMIQR